MDSPVVPTEGAGEGVTTEGWPGGVGGGGTVLGPDCGGGHTNLYSDKTHRNVHQKRGTKVM